MLGKNWKVQGVPVYYKDGSSRLRMDAIDTGSGTILCYGSHKEEKAIAIAALPDLLEFIESITDPSGPYKDLDDHPIVAAAYKLSSKARGK